MKSVLKSGLIQPLFTFILLLACKFCFSQNNQYEVVSVQDPITYSINSAANILGKSKVSLRIQLPENTVRWYYVASASKNSENKTTLFSQLLKLLGPKGEAASLLADVVVPPGDAKADFYVISEGNNSSFLNNKEFRYSTEGSTMSTTSAKMEIKNPFEKIYYLGINNPGLSSVKVSIEVVAVIKVTGSKYGSLGGIRTDWQGQNGKEVVDILKNQIDREMLFDKAKLIGTKTAIEDLKECIVNKIIESQTLEQYLKEPSASRDWNLRIKYKECLPLFVYAKTDEEDRAFLYGNLGWRAYEDNQIDKAIELTEQSLSITPLFYVQANRAFFYLVKGEEAKAIDAYMLSLNVLTNDRQTKSKKASHVRGCLNDIKSIEYKNIGGTKDAITILNKALTMCQ